MDEGQSRTEGFDRDVISSAGAADHQSDLRGIITSIARASHDIADLVSLGRLAPPRRRPGSSNGSIEVGTTAAASARQILIEHLDGGCVGSLYCAGEPNAITVDVRDETCQRHYSVTVDPLEGAPDPDANLPFGTIFSIAVEGEAPGSAPPLAAGFIHYGPQTNLVIALGTGVHIFNLDRPTRTYRLAAENIRIPKATREWAVDATKRGRWPASIRALIDEHLEESDAPGAVPADMRWTGSIVSDAYRILRRGGVYICPEDDQPGREDSCPNLRYAARPIAFIMEQAGGCATTGDMRIVDMTAKNASERTPMIFGSCSLVERFKRLHALPESHFDGSPLFRKRGLFRVEAD